MTISSIEVWSSMLVLHTVQTGPEVPGTQFRPWSGIGLRDDVGTTYQPHMNGAGGSQQMVFVRYGFTPAPPTNASALWLEIPGEEVIEITLQS